MATDLRFNLIDYTRGWFFVTMQAAGNKSVFGAIDGGRLLPSDLGRAVAASWEFRRGRHPCFFLDAYVLMPNHFHAIVHVRPDKEMAEAARKGDRRAGLPALLQGFKSYTTSQIYWGFAKACLCDDIGPALWQESFYDSLVLGKDRLDATRAYIRNNPGNWEGDRFGPVTAHHVGNLELLRRPLAAFVASEFRRGDAPAAPGGGCAGARRPDTSGMPVLSTFTSRQECAVLSMCLRARREFVGVMPRGIPGTLPPGVAEAVGAGRALLLSPVEAGGLLKKPVAVWCNRYVLNHAAVICTGRIRAGGSLALLLRARNRPWFPVM